MIKLVSGGSQWAARFRHSAVVTAVFSLTPSSAFAHAFSAGADKYAQFLEGSAVAITVPSMMLPLAALGVLLGLWRQDGMVKVWPLYLVTVLIGGGGLAPFVEAWIIPAFIGLGLLVATAAALAPKLPSVVAFLGAGLTGLAGASTALEGHAFLELPFFTYLGIFFGLNLTVAFSAAVVSASLQKWSVGWLRIAWRVAASWIAAILVLYLAFLISAPDVLS